MVRLSASHPRMNHYICINESGLTALGDRYKVHVAVTVQSSVQNTNLSTHLIYDGPITDYIRQLQDLGCSIIQHELSFKGRLRDVCNKSSVNFDVASGAFLRLDIPLLDKGDGYAIYTDVDVMFRSDPDFSSLSPTIMAAAPEMNIENYNHINSGVLLINLPGLRQEIPDFTEKILSGNLKTSSGDPYDQGHINDFFRGRLNRLDPKFNWKPYWGFNEEASIVHWHGVKYPAAKAISLGLEKTITNYHPHPEIYRRSPSGYRAYMEEYEKIVNTLPKSLLGARQTGNRFDSQKTSAPPCGNVLKVVGSSHAVRWQWHLRDGLIPSRLSANRFFGVGGAPVWSSTLFEQSVSALDEAGRIILLVPDFRFGNEIVLDSKANAGPLQQDGFLGINPAALTTENDRLMLKRGMDALHLWHQRFGERAQYVFWCLFGRQVHDRLAGKYVGEGRYHHPVFNYDEITAALPDLEIIDLSPLLRRPMHDVRRLFIDTSSHPSQVGYLLLNGLLFDGLDAITAYDRAVATVEEDLVALARKAREKVGKPVLLTGRSIWLDVLMQILGATGVSKLAEAGLVLVPLDRHPGQPTPAEMLQRYPLASCQAFVVSAGGGDLSALLDRLFSTASGFWHSQPCLDWESATEPIIRQRGETPQFIRINTQLPAIGAAIRLNLPAHAVEQGPLGMPSWSGIVAVLQALAEKLAASPTWRTEGEVLLTRDNVAFLIGGNHAVLKFATGELRPSAKSLAAFRANIVSRVALAQNIRCPYLHVIFPDKHSVLSNAFPITPLHRLGDAYMAQLGPALKAHVLWPADQLKLETENPYLPLDTHMTDLGSLAVLRMMLQAIGMEANVALDRIRSRIVRPQRWQGDLGSKFDPPLFQEGLVLEPDWPQKKFRSSGGFNDGMVDVVFNTEALADKTVLLLGDSFFRMMLDHLSAVFSRVICLRTRFLHPEMITLIKPDIIFTGNAERYLSNVIPDTEAHAFALYPYLRGASDLIMDDQFLKAWAAVTAPDSERSKRFFAELGFELRASKDN